MKKLKLLRKIEIILVVLLLLQAALWLPNRSYWHFYTQAKQLLQPSSSSLTDWQMPPQPQVDPVPGPQLSAPNYILLDLATNTIILSQNHHQPIYPASITKLATALTALNIYPLNEPITVDQEYDVGKVMGLKISEQLSVQSLVSALLVYSANDAAYVLANHHSQGLSGFIDQMNQIAQKYQLKNTHFVNVDGIHHPDHYSSVYDLSQLARLATKNTVVRQVVKTKTITISDNQQLHQYTLDSTNELLEIAPEVEGLKTGWTPEAGGCFVGLLNIDGHYLISVVAQSEDRFQDTKKLIDWAKANLVYVPYQ